MEIPGMPTLGILLIVFWLVFGPMMGHSQSTFREIPGGIVAGNARITLLTQTLARLEYSTSGSFTDSLTALVVNRHWSPPRVSRQTKAGWIILATDKITIRYRSRSGPFNGDNLVVGWKIAGKEYQWTPATIDSSNLGGISYSLDGAKAGKLSKQPPGILSRQGYFLLDDSRTPLWDGSSRWIVPRSDSTGQDWYFFVYGNDYAHVLKEYSELCGKIPMIPKYVLGAWATDLNYEYIPSNKMVSNYHYTDDSVRSIITRFRQERIPLDVMVLDFAWHLRGWHGSYDWSPIFPKPVEFLNWAHSNGIKVTLNDHPGYAKETVLSNEDSRATLVREALNMPLPPNPTITISLLGAWKFHTDPKEVGDPEAWYADTLNDSSWTEIPGDRPWEDRGYPGYDGVAWYRKWISIPLDVHSAHLFAAFGSVDDEYDIFVNGRKAAHHASSWNTLTTTDILPLIKKGEKNLIVLRVTDLGGEGGLSGPTAMITDVVRQEGLRFNLAEKPQAEAFMNILHKPLIDEGVSFWWVDGGLGASEMPGLNGQMWTNRVFYEFTEQQTGKRSFIFSRYGGWGNHRYPSLFTGDTYSQWDVLRFEVPYTAQGGNVLMPYITHDIGGFIGKDISLDLYVRWLQFGVFSPMFRLHSAHENPAEGNVRMPWTYGAEGVRIARDLFRLRYQLIPYIYTMTRTAHDESLPLVRPLYLEYPEVEQAYREPYEYFFGNAMLVAPILDSSGVRKVYLPPGEWEDYFSGSRYNGDTTMLVHCTLETMPVYVRAGSVIPQQPDMQYVDQRPLDSLIVNVYGPQRSEYALYEDDGVSLRYRQGESALTPISFMPAAGKAHRLLIGPTRGEFEGQPLSRAYFIRIAGISRPKTVRVNGKQIDRESRSVDRWKWDPANSSLVLEIGKKSIREALVINLR